MRCPVLALVILGVAALPPGAAQAQLEVRIQPQQATAEPRVNQLIVYGDDKCPESSDAEIVVCARKDEGERFRIPDGLRTSDSPSNEAWTNKVTAYETVSRTGTLSCSPTGAGGWTGCAGRLIDAAYAEKRESPDVRFSELIAIERAKRLATIDADASETQARVEAIEKDIEARKAATPEELARMKAEEARRKAQEAAERGEDVPADLPPAKPK